MHNTQSIARFAWLSIAAALITIVLKTTAYLLTGSVGLLSDALESLINLAAAILALITVSVAARPPDESHMFGHEKAEYFSSGIEGALILVAAVSIIGVSVERLLQPQPLEQAALGLLVTVVASLVNFGVARVLVRAGRRFDSIALEADAQHLMTDVWTSVGVIGGVAAVALTGWTRLDPLIALAVAANIIWSGVQLLRRSVRGLMDVALPDAQLHSIRRVLARYRSEGVYYHALRTRQSGRRSFVSVHVLVPGEWSVQRGHKLLERVEQDIRDVVSNGTVFTHLEPLEDPLSWQDMQLDREAEE